MGTQPIRKKPPRDINSVERAIFLRTFILILRWALIPLPIFIYKFGILGFFLWLLGCLTLSIAVEFATDRVGSLAGRFYTGRKADWSLQEQLRGSIDIVRFQKLKGKYETALVEVDKILAKDPDFAEAVFLKAQILYEGYGDRREAIQHLNKVIYKIKPKEPIPRWAHEMKKQISS